MDEEATNNSLSDFLNAAAQVGTAALQNQQPKAPAPVAARQPVNYAPLFIGGGVVALLLIIVAFLSGGRR